MAPLWVNHPSTAAPGSRRVPDREDLQQCHRIISLPPPLSACSNEVLISAFSSLRFHLTFTPLPPSAPSLTRTFAGGNVLFRQARVEAAPPEALQNLTGIRLVLVFDLQQGSEDWKRRVSTHPGALTSCG